MNIVITGGSRGLGKAIAEKFAGDKQGHTLLLGALNNERLEREGRQLQGRFPRTTILTKACDLSVRQEVGQFGDWVLQKITAVDVLVNNAGIFISGNVHDEDDGAMEKTMDVNFFSAYHLTRKLLPGMIARKSGHIFNISSIAALKAYPGGGSYSISKFALHGFSVNLREELKPHNIKVTTVFPGAAYTDSWASSGLGKERFIDPDDVASMIYAAAQLSPRACVEDIILRPQGGDI